MAPAWRGIRDSDPALAETGSNPSDRTSREFLARVAKELALLPEESAIAEMLADYAVMREQARVCRH